MPAYDDRLFSPAAPVAQVKLRSSTGKSQSDIPLVMRKPTRRDFVHIFEWLGLPDQEPEHPAKAHAT